jgi:hypothetical protein
MFVFVICIHVGYIYMTITQCSNFRLWVYSYNYLLSVSVQLSEFPEAIDFKS